MPDQNSLLRSVATANDLLHTFNSGRRGKAREDVAPHLDVYDKSTGFITPATSNSNQSTLICLYLDFVMLEMNKINEINHTETSVAPSWSKS